MQFSGQTGGQHIYHTRQGGPLADDRNPHGHLLCNNCAPFLANLYCFSYQLAFLRSLVRSQNARQKDSREHTLIRRMRNASRYIDDLLTVNFPEFEEVMNRARGEVDPQGTTGGPLTGIYPNTFSNGGTEQQGLVLERVQPGEYIS